MSDYAPISLEDQVDHNAKIVSTKVASSIFNAICMERAANSLKECQEKYENKMCEQETIAFATEASGRSCTECNEKMFQAAKTQCGPSFDKFALALHNNNNLFRNVPNEYQALKGCLEKTVQ